ncbi:MAG TPA: DUF4476 domain-containing protein [Bacteroidia bacterium]|nr:DUF4476 domain-containing protein [Bacteroidia bacterium]HNU34039.1 DUF4476 domain-containing protein [Bacteroidia bacterium]
MIKKLAISAMLLLFITMAKAQTANAVLFTENGERFYVILNGLRMNDQAQTNVKLTELTADWYKMKVIFEDKTLGEENFNLALSLGNEVAYAIKKNNKGKYVLRPISETPLAQAPPPAPQQQVVVYNPSAPVYQEGGSVTHTTTTTTTTQGSGNMGDGENISFNMGVNVGETGGSINMNVGGMDINGSSTTTTTHSHTTTTTTSSSSNSTPPPPPPSYLPGYTGPVGCPVPMNPGDFADLKNTIASKDFEDTRMTIAKSVLKNHCLFVSQVKDLMGLFTFENTKLDFAKYAYSYTYDQGNYFKVNDMFDFESSISDLDKYINSRR